MSSSDIYCEKTRVDDETIPYHPDIHPRDPKRYPGGKVTDLASFIKRAEWTHGVGRFDYSKAIYTKSNQKLIVICHGGEKHSDPYEIYTRANGHLSGKACPKCSGKYQWTTPEWVCEANKKWGDAFDYSEVEYRGAFKKVWLTHRECGNRFSVTADNHMRGRGCPKCKSTNPKRYASTEEYLNELVRVRGDLYDTSEVKLVAHKKHITLKCKKHDIWFKVTPYEFIDKPSKQSCPECLRLKTIRFYPIEEINISLVIKHPKPTERRSKTRFEWIARATEKHATRGYDYSRLDEHPINKQEIFCKKHSHSFFLTFTEHVRIGTKCRYCAAEDNVGGYHIDNLGNHDPDMPATLYHVKITNNKTGHSFMKVGVTKQKYVNSRFCSGKFKSQYHVDIIHQHKTTLLDALILEEKLMGKIGDMGYRYLEHELKGHYIGGWTECYRIKDTHIMDLVDKYFDDIV